MSRKPIILSLFFCLLITASIVALFQGSMRLWSHFHGTGNADYNADNAGNLDYNQIVNNSAFAWTGPKPGEKIDLDNFVSEEKKVLKTGEGKLTILALVSSKCERSALAIDQLQYVNSIAVKSNIAYHVVSLGTNETPDEFFGFARTLRIPSEAYIWKKDKSTISRNLQNMVVPSHILVDQDGTVIKRFPGAVRGKQLRDKMTSQIVQEVLDEKAKSDSKN